MNKEKIEKELKELKKNRKIFRILGYSFFGASILTAIASLLCFTLIEIPEGEINIIGYTLFSLSDLLMTSSIVMFLLGYFLFAFKIAIREQALYKMNHNIQVNNININPDIVDAKAVVNDRDQELLEQYRKLKDQGIISEEDFKKKEEELTNNKRS